MNLNLTPEEKEAFAPVARLEAREFLQAELAAIEAKINKRLAHQEQYHSDGALPEEEAAFLTIYEQKKALIEELIAENEEQLFIDVLRRRLHDAQKREMAMAGRAKTNPAARLERKRVKDERDMLNELQRSWLNWLKEQ
jgi:hypothetical protein